MTRVVARSLVALAAWLGTFLVDASSTRASATVTTSVAGIAIISIDGEILPQDVTAVEQSISKNRIKEVWLNSTGGDAFAAMAIGRMIRKNWIRAHVLPFGKCFSSCALVYIAGVERLNMGTIGLHRPYLAGPPLTEAQLSEAVPKMLSAIRFYVTEMGISDEFSNIMMNTDPENVRIFEGSDILQIVPKQDPLYNEAVVAHDARGYGLTTQEYRRRATASLSCGPYTIPGLDDCSRAMLWGLSAQDYQDRNKQTQGVCQRESAEYWKLVSSGIVGTKGSWNNPIVLTFESCIRKVMLGR
jgi:hypothetical protein